MTLKQQLNLLRTIKSGLSSALYGTEGLEMHYSAQDEMYTEVIRHMRRSIFDFNIQINVIAKQVEQAQQSVDKAKGGNNEQG